MARVVAALALPFVLAVAACGGSGGGSTAAEPETVVVTVAPSTEETTSTEAAAEPDCGADAFLPILKDAYDGTAPKLEIVEARVERCRNGFAQVFAVPDPDVCKPGKGFCYETEQVFLEFQDGAWTIATSGTGIACGSETDAEIVRICRGLGYPDLATPGFQMPSKNIGCLLGGGVLRCDILSGLNPEPATACELDWVGLVLARSGPAEPQCAGDTVYDRRAPTLAYGATWRRSGFACESSESGLRCTGPAGESFKLAREGWTVG